MSKPRDAQLQRRHNLRCAIYTRKSSEEGLEQEFNSLHAQREACEAFIRSQRHEGWACLPQAYDDGGISGATMERPALQQLLADIGQGKVDVVLYKIDRLTRSLPISRRSPRSSMPAACRSCRSRNNSTPRPRWVG
jgi:DNA invertase Pin-like site-specific DNA recombinase